MVVTGVRGIRTLLRETYRCERCGAEPGGRCVSESGREQAEVHASRWRQHHAAQQRTGRVLPELFVIKGGR